MKIDIAELNIRNSIINLNTDIDKAFILSGELSKINIYTSHFTMKNNNYSKTFNTDNFIIFNTFCNISIKDSFFINKRENGKILFMDNENFVSKKQVINNLTLKNKKIIIKTFLRNIADNKILLSAEGFKYQDKKYIFSNKYILDDKLVFDLHILSDSLDNINYNKNVRILYLYKLDISNSCIEENHLSSDFMEKVIFPENYIVTISNTNLISKKFSGIINKHLNEENMLVGSYIDSKGNINTSKDIYSKKIVSDGILLDNIGLKKYRHNQNEGYSLLYEAKKLGDKSIDFSFIKDYKFFKEFPYKNYDDFGSYGDLSCSFGYKNLSEGQLSFSIGYNCHSYGFGSFSGGLGTYTYEDFGFTIGKYNSNYNLNNRLFTIGNGEDDNNRSDALVVYDDGSLYVKKSIVADTFSDGVAYLSNGDLLGLNNLETDNIIIDEDIKLDGYMLGLE